MVVELIAQMQRERRKANGGDHHEFLFADGGNSNAGDRIASGADNAASDCFDHDSRDLYSARDGNSPAVKLYPVTSSSPASPPHRNSVSSSSGTNFIEHPVSRFDTLAGVAIRYGVEVADIKKLNSLVTDIQMFALKTLLIPLPGRHPPSLYSSNGSDAPGGSIFEHTPPHHVHNDLFESFLTLRVKSPQQRASPAMSSLQGYYGLKSDQKARPGGCEMAVNRNGGSHYLEDGPFLRPSPATKTPLSRHRKSLSLVNGFLDENGEVIEHMVSADARESEPDKWNEKLLRRRQNSESDFMSKYNTSTPETMLKEDNSSGGFLTTSGKGLALRSKAACRTPTTSGAEAGGNASASGDSVAANGFTAVRKSSSTSSLQDQESSSSSSLSSIWPTSKWCLKPDLQALSSATKTRPIFDGLPRPARRNKAALD